MIIYDETLINKLHNDPEFMTEYIINHCIKVFLIKPGSYLIELKHYFNVGMYIYPHTNMIRFIFHDKDDTYDSQRPLRGMYRPQKEYYRLVEYCKLSTI